MIEGGKYKRAVRIFFSCSPVLFRLFVAGREPFSILRDKALQIATRREGDGMEKSGIKEGGEREKVDGEEGGERERERGSGDR